MAPQYGPHRWSAGFHEPLDLREARFSVADLTGARIVDADLTGVRIVDSWIAGVTISGFIGQLVVNGVDVTDYVEAELDRRHPERVRLREMACADDFRALWSTVEGLWASTTSRALDLPAAALDERVHDEWSFAETLRHLVFITDSWASRTILDLERPFHALALPQTAYNPADARALGMTLDAGPSLDAVLAARADRQAVVTGILADLKDADLGRLCSRPPAPGYPQEARPVAECLAVVLEEEIEHHRFAVRDLEVLEAR